MQIPKPTDADKERFRALVPDDQRVAVKPMFGNLAAFVNGNMFMGLFGSDVGLRLAPDDSARLLKEDGAGPFGPSERPMGGYTSMPAGWTTKKASGWIAKSLEHTAAMPPKVKKPAKKAK